MKHKENFRGVGNGHLIKYVVDQSEGLLIAENLTHPAILERGNIKKFTISSIIKLSKNRSLAPGIELIELTEFH